MSLLKSESETSSNDFPLNSILFPRNALLKNLLPLLDDIHIELYQQLTFIDLIPFLEDLVRNNPNPRLQRHSILHPTCSTDKMGDIESLSGVSKFPARIKCALLGWKTLEQAIDVSNSDEIVTTDDEEQ